MQDNYADAIPFDSEFSSLKTPPQSISAEQSVLGGLLLSNEAWFSVAEVITETDFYTSEHRLIFRSIRELIAAGHPCDVITLSEWLEKSGKLTQVGGLIYLGKLADIVPNAANIIAYADIVRQRSILRQLIQVGTEITNTAFNTQGKSTAQLLDYAEKQVFQIAEQINRGGSGFTTIKDILVSTLDRIDALFQRQDAITGVPTGFTDLDEKTSGLQPSDLIIVAGRPSMGKTSLAMNIAESVAIKERLPVAVFSMEMPNEQLGMRLISSLGRINQQRVRTGRLEDEDWARITSAISLLSESPLFIDDTPALNPTELRARSRRLAREQGKLGLIVIDYIQLMQGSDNSKESRAAEVSEISRSLKALAKELHVPIIALSQLNRGLEQRPDKRPRMADLRESGCLTGDSLVTRADTGERVAIKELQGQKDFLVWALNEQTLKLEAIKVSKVFATGIKPVFRLTTQLGRTICATANHKFYTSEGWQRLDKLTTESYLALPRIIPEPMLPLPPVFSQSSELALLARLIGDGCTLPRHVIQYTTRETDLSEIVAQLAIDSFKGEIKPRVSKERSWYQVYLTSTRKHTHGVRNAISEWLDKLGIFGLRSYEKYIPEAVFKEKNENIALFLKHLWVTDGCIKLVKGKKVKPSIYYASSSHRLCVDIQSLLLKLGINARLRKVPQGDKGRIQYHVILSGKIDILNFATKIDTIGNYKTSALEEIKSFYQQKNNNTNRDIIPCHLWVDDARLAMQLQEITTREFYKKLGNAYSGMTVFKQNVSRERMRRIAETTQSNQLTTLAESDIYWDKVISIEPLGEKKVYDLTVPHLHNFVANDVIVHNSIEQDADLIIFIYRDEVYHEDSEDKGTAEIIIGKQRNGPIGTVKLTFLGELTRFENHTEGFYSE